jgi:outer membrane lipopolysaccharide assembly protein LptE/RlpB
MRRALALAALLLLPGCGYRLIGPSGAEPSGVPIARASNGAQASFSLTTCAPNTERARLVEEIVLQLQAQGVIATADGPGTQSRVVLNLCGAGGQPAPSAARTTR